MSYFDSNLEAQMLGQTLGRMEGERRGRREGFKTGQQNGYDIGYTDGRADGYNAGWNAAIERANQEIVKQLAFTRQHVADKAALNEQIEKIAVEAAQHLEDKAALSEQIEKINIDAAATREKANEFAWNINSCALMLNCFRSVLEELIAKDGPEAEHVRELFLQHYALNTEKALKNGAIREQVHTDANLNLPKTQTFIADLLAYSLKMKQAG